MEALLIPQNLTSSTPSKRTETIYLSDPMNHYMTKPYTFQYPGSTKIYLTYKGGLQTGGGFADGVLGSGVTHTEISEYAIPVWSAIDNGTASIVASYNRSTGTLSMYADYDGPGITGTGIFEVEIE